MRTVALNTKIQHCTHNHSQCHKEIFHVVMKNGHSKLLNGKKSLSMLPFMCVCVCVYIILRRDMKQNLTGYLWVEEL